MSGENRPDVLGSEVSRQDLRKNIPEVGGDRQVPAFVALFALESNGLRVLVRLGYAREEKSYASTYRALRSALSPLEVRGSAWLQRAHLLLQRHGQELCKTKLPRCDECPLRAACPAAE